MVKSTFFFSICAAVYLLVSPLFASSPNEKMNLEDKKATPLRERSSTLPNFLSSSPSSDNNKGILSMFSKLNPRRKSEEHTPPPLSPTASPALLKELQERQTIRAQEQQVTTQEQKEEFPPKRLSPKQVQSIMKASFPLVLAKLSNELKETDPPEKNNTFVELNNEIRASIHQTSLARFTGLLVATQTDYVNSLQKSQQKAKEDAFISLNQIHTDKDSPDRLKTYKDCTIDDRICQW